MCFKTQVQIPRYIYLLCNEISLRYFFKNGQKLFRERGTYRYALFSPHGGRCREVQFVGNANGSANVSFLLSAMPLPLNRTHHIFTTTIPNAKKKKNCIKEFRRYWKQTTEIAMLEERSLPQTNCVSTEEYVSYTVVLIAFESPRFRRLGNETGPVCTQCHSSESAGNLLQHKRKSSPSHKSFTVFIGSFLLATRILPSVHFAKFEIVEGLAKEGNPDILFKSDLSPNHLFDCLFFFYLSLVISM